jgi:hypothetical protein
MRTCFVSMISICLADTEFPWPQNHATQENARQCPALAHPSSLVLLLLSSHEILQAAPLPRPSVSRASIYSPHHLKSYSLPLNNHLRNTLSAQCLTRSKLLLLQPRQRIERRSDKQHYRRRNQARGVADKRKPLYDAHDAVDRSTHVVCLEASDEAVEVL